MTCLTPAQARREALVGWLPPHCAGCVTSRSPSAHGPPSLCLSEAREAINSPAQAGPTVSLLLLQCNQLHDTTVAHCPRRPQPRPRARPRARPQPRRHYLSPPCVFDILWIRASECIVSPKFSRQGGPVPALPVLVHHIVGTAGPQSLSERYTTQTSDLLDAYQTLEGTTRYIVTNVEER